MTTIVSGPGYVQRANPGKEAGTMMLKRQRTRPRKHRSSKHGPDYSWCETEEDRQNAYDEFYTPRDLFPLRSPSSSPEPLNPHRPLPLHRSRPRPSPRFQGNPNNTSGRGPNLEDALRDLQMRTGEEDKDQLTPSAKAKKKLEELAKERERKKEEAAKEALRKAKEAAALARKERRLTRRDPITPLIKPLSDFWRKKIHDARAEGVKNDSPLVTALSRSELHDKDFNTVLKPQEWLNDEIINAYLEWVTEAANKAAEDEAASHNEAKPTVPRYITHNSFFYDSLVKRGPSSTTGPMRRKKAAGKSMMEVDAIFIPICSGVHWTLMVVRPTAKTIEYIDSMWGPGHRYIANIRTWLEFQLGNDFVERDWKVINGANVCTRQNNGYDCGVFVCTNALCVALGLKTTSYTASDLTNQRDNIAAVILNRGFHGDFAYDQLG